MIRKLSCLTLVLPIAATFVACSSDSDSSDDVSSQDVKSNYSDMAYAVYSDSLSTALDLKSAIDTLLATPTETNLAAARAAYKETRIPYQQSEILRWDTTITLGKNLDQDGGPASVDDWEGQVNAWPLDENHIINIIAGNQPISTELLISQNGADNNEANVTTGIHAVEFMLWGPDTHGTNPGAGERPASDFATDGSCTDGLCQRRADYLSSAIELLVSDLTEMTAEWSPEATETPGTLSYNFLNSNKAIDYIVGAMRAMATAELASARMGSGLQLGDPEEEHDCFSDLSHVAIYYNFQGVKNAFYGQYGDNSGASVADLVKQNNEELFTQIEQAFQSIESDMRTLFDAGEQTPSPVRFDQIIGQSEDMAERQSAESAVNKLIGLEASFIAVQQLLSLDALPLDGDGDGD
jgi:putative iron-regulated protein